MIIRGDILLVDLSKGKRTIIGSEQYGYRPCIVVSNNVCNRFSPTITVVPISTKRSNNVMPTQFFLDPRKYNVEAGSRVLGEQIITISLERICRPTYARLDEEDMRTLEKVLAIQLGLPNPAPSLV